MHSIKTPPHEESEEHYYHWSDGIHDVVLSLSLNCDDGPFRAGGGSENAQFLYITQLRSEKLTYLRGDERLLEEELILEIQREKVAGWTSYDCQRLLDEACRRGGPLALRTVKPGFLDKDLRTYLNQRFIKSSLDHDLQTTIRDNVYSKTVPCTTRRAREGEVDGEVYRFITREEFEALERNGELLESGIYEGNFYGTPKPPKVEEYELDAAGISGGDESTRIILVDSSGNQQEQFFEENEEERRRRRDSLIERRRRNRTDLGDMAPLFIADMKPPPNHAEHQHQQQQQSAASTSNNLTQGDNYNNYVAGNGNGNGHGGVDDGLGQLPFNWELGYTENGEKYFIDHNNGMTQWNDPRKGGQQQQPSSNQISQPIADIDGDALPSGWERVDDPQFGVYYVDHINKTTQYEKPTLPAQGGHHHHQQHQQQQQHGNGTNHQHQNYQQIQKMQHQQPSVQPRRVNSVPDIGPRKTNESPHKALFTLDPRELRGEMITTTLTKGSKGLGFTLVGNDRTTPEEEFLQIRTIIRDGPADRDGKLRMGDILVYVNHACVLGYHQNDIIRIFQSINVGESVVLIVCRGYPFLFDPSNATNNDIVTHDAYSITGSESSPSPLAVDLNQATTRAETMGVRIQKGDMGFGFTIADGPYGQKVKKILDKPRCAGLMENDVLCEINGQNVRKMGHAEIVDVLKDCPVGADAMLLVQRTYGGTMKRSQTDMGGPPPKPPSVPAKPTNRPHSYHPSYNGNNDFERRSKTPTAEIARQYSESSHMLENGPSVRPRSKTPGPQPNRPHKASNGYVTNGGTHHYPRGGGGEMATYEAGAGGVPIYENFPKNGRQAFNNDPQQISPNGGRPKTPSSSSFASATPNYIPASFYSRHHGPTPTPTAVPAVAPRYTPTMLEEEQYDYIVVNLIRQSSGFGFRVIGGTEEQTQTSVGQIVAGGAAEKDGRLKLGDEIVEIDGQLMLSAAHQHAVRAMSQASQNGYVKLVVRRRRTTYATPIPDYQQITRQSMHSTKPQHQLYPYDVTVVRSDTEGFGFQIVSSVYRSGSCIGKIIDGSPAARVGVLKVNDRIIAINAVNILRMHHGEIVNLIRDSGNVVTLTVGAPEDNPMSAAPIVSPSSVVPMPRDMNAMERRYSLASEIERIEQATPPASEMLEYRYDINVSEPPSPDWPSSFGPYEQLFATKRIVGASNPNKANSCFSVELQRGNKGFGFSIRGGQEFANMPLLVLRIAEGGPAHMDGRLKVGDQLIEINGVSTNGMTHAEAIELIKREPIVRLIVKRQPESTIDMSALADALQPENAYGRIGGPPTYAMTQNQNNVAPNWSSIVR